MKASAFFAVLLAVSPASAQTRVAVRPVALPVPAVYAPAFAASPSAAVLPAFSAATFIAPTSFAPASVSAAAAVPISISATNARAALAVAALAKTPGANAALTSGRELEALLTGAVFSAADEAPALSPDAAFALGASRALAARADDLGDAKGLKAATMSGGDFLALLDEAVAQTPPAPSPAAAAAAREVETALTRVARALIPADKPARESLPRALAVWQVFDQELALAAEQGGLDALIADARLFASQVEASVAPAEKKEQELSPPTSSPEDPNGYKKMTVPGSVFGWKPIQDSPGHGFRPLDALIRRALSEKKSPYADGFDFPGAPTRADARVFFYGERHTDPGLIRENMRLLVQDAKPGRPMIVLVESYTGPTKHGYAAMEYLGARGLDPAALKERGVASADVEVRGWDSPANYEASRRPQLQHHMDLLALNHLAHGELRGWRYYREVLRAAWTAWRSRRALWKAALVTRNRDLDESVARAAFDADAAEATLHVIAGTDHLVQNPRLARWPLIGRPSLRRSLRRAIDARAYWASQPPNTIP